ncbi:hypothetical protein QQP08_000619 [Theobroma cacao]|nr:hypothetical protein QQP08_000619 [Theobroma cacao]
MVISLAEGASCSSLPSVLSVDFFLFFTGTKQSDIQKGNERRLLITCCEKGKSANIPVALLSLRGMEGPGCDVAIPDEPNRGAAKEV